jgi:hypothetical protein
MARKKHQPYIVSSTSQLLILASPGREEIVDAVGLLGPCSVPELAQFLGRPRNALYYHIRELRDCGLLLESKTQRDGIKTTAVYDVPGRPVVVRYDLSTPRNRKAVIEIARARFRSGQRGFVRACTPKIAVTEGPTRNLWVAHWKGWLSEAHLLEANKILNELVDLFGRAAHAGNVAGDPHEITFSIAPVISKSRNSRR